MNRLVELGRKSLVAGLVLWPSVSQACAVCVGGSDRSNAAFFDATIVMSVLPLGMIGGGLWWLRRRGGDLLSKEFEERDDLPPEGPGQSRQDSR
jgi:hypothetical protein